jgi:hypothetical protein
MGGLIDIVFLCGAFLFIETALLHKFLQMFYAYNLKRCFKIRSAQLAEELGFYSLQGKTETNDRGDPLR